MLVIVMVALTGGAVIATMYFRVNVPSTVIVTSFEIEIWNEAKTEEIITFDFGILMPGEAWTTQAVYVKNVGDEELWSAALNEVLPPGFLLIVEYTYDTTWNPWTLGAIFGDGANPSDGGILPGDFSTVMLRFTLANTDAVSGTYPFMIGFEAYSTKTG